MEPLQRKRLHAGMPKNEKKKKKWNRNVLSHNISELNNREDAENSIKGGIGLTIEQDTKAATHI